MLELIMKNITSSEKLIRSDKGGSETTETN